MAKLTNEERLAKLLARKQKDEEELKKLKAEIKKEEKRTRRERQTLLGEAAERKLPKRAEAYSEEEFKELLVRWKAFLRDHAQELKEIL